MSTQIVRRKTYRKKGKGKYATSKRVVPDAIKDYVKRSLMRKIEHKWKASSFQLQPDYIAPSNMFQFLNGIGQGSGAGDRIGAKITMKEFSTNITVTAKEGVFTRLRILCFLDKQTNGTLPGNNADISSIFANQGPGGNPTAVTAVLNQHYFPSRYKLLFDKLVTLDLSTNGSAAVSRERTIRVRKYMNTRVQYSGSSNDIPSIVKNSLIMYAVSDETATNAPTVIGQYTIKYIDA